MRRVIALSAVLTVLLVSCGEGDIDAQTLRRRLVASEREPRAFVYRALSRNISFTARGRIEDDLRYAMTLGARGRDLIEYVVSDDALAVRLLDPALGSTLANELGHPTVDEALRSGRWVVDPSGAPPVFQAETVVGGETTGDAFRDAREVFRFLSRAISEARNVRAFKFEDIDYRPAFDPWRYPSEARGEARFDMLRPFLPRQEDPASGGDVSISHFRKLSVFTTGNRIMHMCEFVDITGHEEIVRLREEGEDSNPFLARMLARILSNQTSVPIETRRVIADFEYAEVDPVVVPPGAVTGRLDVFMSAFQKAVSGGVLRPQGEESLEQCSRRD